MYTKVLLIYLAIFNAHRSIDGLEFSREKMNVYRDKVKSMFYHAYNGYLKYAYPYDELKPITCAGVDTWGSFSLTLIDALDTLVVMGNYSEFRRAADLVVDRIDFDADVNVSVFETNIRVVGGLLSAHMLSKMGGLQLEDGWPCSGPLLRLAERVANKLMPAFNTFTGMPYGTVNLRRGVHKSETPITCTAGVGTYLLEFASLSRLTGSPHTERVAMKALMELWKYRSAIGLVGNHINVQSGAWTATDSGIGAGVDSYFEYLVKGAVMFDKPELMRQFKEYLQAINTHVKQDDWFVWVTMTKGQVTLPVFQSLEAFWPGLLTLVGDVDSAMRIVMNYYQVLKQFGFTPEFYNIPSQEAVHKRSGYPLRPELAESLMYLYRATGDPLLLQIGAELVEAIEHSARTKCGYATVHDVKHHVIEDRMESFFLSETTKYLYLLFDPDNFVHNPGTHGTIVQTPNGRCVVYAGGYVFNTEAHIFDPSQTYCCSRKRQRDVRVLAEFEDNLDLVDLFGLSDDLDEEEVAADLDDAFAEDVDRALERAAGDEKARSERALADVEFQVEGEETKRSLTEPDDLPPELSGSMDSISPSLTVEANTQMDNSLRSTNIPILDSVNHDDDSQRISHIDEITDEEYDDFFKSVDLLADDQLASRKDYQCRSELSTDGSCRIIDRDPDNPTFVEFLRIIYRQHTSMIDPERRECAMDEAYDGDSGDRGDSRMESSSDDSSKSNDSSDEDYFTTHPDYETLDNEDHEDWKSPGTVSKIDPRRFNYSDLIDWQNSLLSCPVLPFSFRITGFGEVMPPR